MLPDDVPKTSPLQGVATELYIYKQWMAKNVTKTASAEAAVAVSCWMAEGARLGASSCFGSGMAFWEWRGGERPWLRGPGALPLACPRAGARPARPARPLPWSPAPACRTAPRLLISALTPFTDAQACMQTIIRPLWRILCGNYYDAPDIDQHRDPQRGQHDCMLASISSMRCIAVLRTMPTFLGLRRPHPANSFTGQRICPVHRSTCEQHAQHDAPFWTFKRQSIYVSPAGMSEVQR